MLEGNKQRAKNNVFRTAVPSGLGIAPVERKKTGKKKWERMCPYLYTWKTVELSLFTGFQNVLQNAETGLEIFTFCAVFSRMQPLWG